MNGEAVPEVMTATRRQIIALGSLVSGGHGTAAKAGNRARSLAPGARLWSLEPDTGPTGETCNNRAGSHATGHFSWRSVTHPG
jgi:hypothetical protein